MKKHLIAAAVAATVAAPAMAQDVQLYGILGAAYTDVKLSAGGADLKQTNTGANNQQAGNRLGFRGTEDLGNGMKANFVYEMNTDVASGMGTVRQGFVGLSGNFGGVRAGRQDTVTRTIYNSFTAHGNTVFAPGNAGGALAGLFGIAYAEDVEGCAKTSYTASQAATCTRISGYYGYGGTRVNGLSYTSPNFNGFTVTAQYGDLKTDYDGDLKAQDKSLNLGLFYSAGPLAIAVGQDKVKVDRIASSTATVATIGSDTNPDTGDTYAVTSSVTRSQGNKVDFTTNMVGVSYDLSVAKLFFAYVDKKVEEATAETDKLKDMTVGVSVPVGAITLVGSYTDGELKDATTKDDFKAYQLQANYALSKRTKAYAMYGQNKYDAAGGEELKQKGFTLGLQHNF